MLERMFRRRSAPQQEEEPYKPNDPTASSVLPMSIENLQEIKRNSHDYPVLRDSAGRHFHEIRRSDGPTQMFFTRIAKGIFPVSDVLYDTKSDKFLSYEMPLDQVAKNEKYLKAGVVLIGDIFRDRDRGWADLKNLARKGDAHVFFDFDKFENFWGKDEDDIQYDIEWSASHKAQRWNAEERQAAINILDALERRFSDEGGLRFMQSVLENMSASKMDTPEIFQKTLLHPEHSLVEFQSSVLGRIRSFRSGLDKPHFAEAE